MKRLLLAFIVLLAAAVPAAADKTYSAERYDVRLDVRPGGSMEVTETVVFRFSGGEFTNVFRELPRRRTDGIDIVRVAMDGVEFSPGDDEPGTYTMTGDSRTRLRWRFAPVTDSVHTFELTYLVHGVVRRDGGADLLWWRALPAEHAYTIDRARVEVTLPAVPQGPIEPASRNVGHVDVTSDGTGVVLDAEQVRKNGWVSLAIRMPEGSVIQAPPRWQHREERARAAAPKWALAAGAILLFGVVLLFALRQGYDAPPRDLGLTSSAPARPDDLEAPIAGMLVTNGSMRLEHAMASLFALADRGDVRIEEQPKGRWGQRQFLVHRTAGARPVRPYEQVLLDIVFTGRHGSEDAVELSAARNRVVRKGKRFGAALEAELAAEGLLDEDRKRIRKRYVRAGLGLILAAAVSPLTMLMLFDEYGPWPLVIAGALALVGLAALITSAALTPLSNEGVRRRRQWALYRKYLDEVAKDRATLHDSPARLLPFAVATGAAAAWSKYLKQHHVEVPPWFRTADGSGGGFAYFVAAGGSGAGHGSGGAGAGGAAGGGASGAS